MLYLPFQFILLRVNPRSGAKIASKFKIIRTWVLINIEFSKNEKRDENYIPIWF